MRSATTGFFSTFASTKSLMRHRSSQRLKNVAASLYGPGPCDTVKAVGEDREPRITRISEESKGRGGRALFPLLPLLFIRVIRGSLLLTEPGPGSAGRRSG